MEKEKFSYKKAFLVQRLQNLRMEFQVIEWQFPQMKREEGEILTVLGELEEVERKVKEEECPIIKV